MSLTAGVVGIALACLLLTALGKKAVLNYYMLVMLVVAALLVAIAASRDETTQELQPDDVVGHDAS